MKITFYNLVVKKLVQVKWSRSQYSEVSRSDIADPSPVRPGQKVTVMWGRQKKEHTAVVECYPVEPEESEHTEHQDGSPPRRAKKKLVSYLLPFLSLITTRQDYLTKNRVNIVESLRTT